VELGEDAAMALDLRSFTERLEDKLTQADAWLEWVRRNLHHPTSAFNEVEVVGRVVEETRRAMLRHRPTAGPLNRYTGIRCFGGDSPVWPCLELTEWSSIWLDNA
jgi:hypothetical protein